MTDSDVAQAIAGSLGLSPRTDAVTEPPVQRDVVDQTQMADWDFLATLARRNKFQLMLSDGKVQFLAKGFVPPVLPVKTRTLEKMALSQIVGFIAAQQGLAPRTVATSTLFQSVAQTNEDDFEFLYRIVRAKTEPDGTDRHCGGTACDVHATDTELKLEAGATPVYSASGSELVRVVDVRTDLVATRYTESSMTTPTGAVQSIAVTLRVRPAPAEPSVTAKASTGAVITVDAGRPTTLVVATLDQQLASLAVVPKIRDKVRDSLAQAASGAQPDAEARVLHSEATRHTETLAVAFSMRLDGEAAIASVFGQPAKAQGPAGTR